MRDNRLLVLMLLCWQVIICTVVSSSTLEHWEYNGFSKDEFQLRSRDSTFIGKDKHETRRTQELLSTEKCGENKSYVVLASTKKLAPHNRRDFLTKFNVKDHTEFHELHGHGVYSVLMDDDMEERVHRKLEDGNSGVQLLHHHGAAKIAKELSSDFSTECKTTVVVSTRPISLLVAFPRETCRTTEQLVAMLLERFQGQNEGCSVTHQKWKIRGQTDTERSGSSSIVKLKLSSRCGPCKRVTESLANVSYVRWIERAPTFDVLNNVASATTQGGTTPTEHPFWEQGLTGAGHLVAVSDSGLAIDSCFFRDEKANVTFYPKMNKNHRKVLSYVECIDTDHEDALEHEDVFHGHGTHVCGSIAGQSLGGYDSYSGLAKDAKLFFVDLTCGTDGGLYLPPDISDVMVAPQAVGARVMSNSWGTPSSYSYYAIADKMVDQFSYYHQDFLAVYAAGNYAFGGILSPAASKNVLSVGAHLSSFDESTRNVMAGFSARGPTFDKRIKPELTGPGQKIFSAASDGKLNSDECSIVAKQGTSMATPFVAASATLVREYFEDGFYPDGVKSSGNRIDLSGPMLKALLIHSTVPMASQTPNNEEGFGRMDPPRILRFASKETKGGFNPELWLNQNSTMQHGTTHRYCFSISETSASGVWSGKLVATFTYFDFAGAAEGTMRSLTNDLDISIVDPDGMIHYPNGLNEFDRVNNVEQVVISSAKAGKYSVYVHGFDVSQYGPYNGQPYALAVSGPGLTAGPQQCGATCPNGCSGNGECVLGQCKCRLQFHHIDCSFCNATTVCHDNGECGIDQVCKCHEHVSSSSSSCEMCEDGWFGARCEEDCSCGSHGRCNYDMGVCKCTNSSETGCWTGAKCDKCCFDYGGSSCNEPSYWCKDKEVREIIVDGPGLIQINGDSHYRNSRRCTWHLVALKPQWVIFLRIRKFNIETPYDFLKVTDNKGKVINRLSGEVGATTMHSEGEMRLHFESDYEQNGEGFVLEFSVQMICADNDCGEHGHCSATTKGCVCDAHYTHDSQCTQCENGWEGDACQNAISPKVTSPPQSYPTSAPSMLPSTTSTPSVPTLPPFTCTTGDRAICSDHGVCGDGNVCVCDWPHAGRTCAATCPKVELQGSSGFCSERGQCFLEDKCICDEPHLYTGKACQVLKNRVLHTSSGLGSVRIPVRTTNQWFFVNHSMPTLGPAPQNFLRLVRMTVVGIKHPVNVRFTSWESIANAGELSSALFDIHEGDAVRERCMSFYTKPEKDQHLVLGLLLSCSGCDSVNGAVRLEVDDRVTSRSMECADSLSPVCAVRSCELSSKRISVVSRRSVSDGTDKSDFSTQALLVIRSSKKMIIATILGFFLGLICFVVNIKYRIRKSRQYTQADTVVFGDRHHINDDSNVTDTSSDSSHPISYASSHSSDLDEDRAIDTDTHSMTSVTDIELHPV